MPPLTINGISISARATSGIHCAPIVIGDEGERAFSGKLLTGVRAEKEALRFRTPPLLKSDADALRLLLRGKGYTWSYDTDLYSDGKHLGPATGTGTVTASGKYGSYLLLARDQLVSYEVGAGAEYTLFRWRKPTVAASWEHWITINGSTHYRNGAAPAAGHVPAWSVISGSTLFHQGGEGFFTDEYDTMVGGQNPAVGEYLYKTVSGTEYLFRCTASSGGGTVGDATLSATYLATATDSGGYTFVNDGTTALRVDDVKFLPYAIPTAWISQLYTEANTRAWTALPALRVAGTLLNDTARTMQGFLGDAPFVPHHNSGSWRDNGEEVDFSLEEV